MVKEHHCPTCGPAVCNALNTRTHVCPKCGTRWEEQVVDSGSPFPPSGAAPG
jgi:transcription initiation factor TFIIIB Brf1 subunit/transcription initiation factor TFIIB